jgi:hypothetical protein
MSTLRSQSIKELSAGSPGETTSVDRDAAERQRTKVDNLASRTHTESAPMTQREERIRGLALNGRKTLIDAYHDPHFCVGSAWASLNMILGELGEAYERPPWNKAPQSDELVSGEPK